MTNKRQSRRLRRAVVFLLLLGGAAVSIAAFAAPDVATSDAMAPYIGAILSGILIPLFLAFRRESRESLHDLRGQVQAVTVAVARLEERDRITALLDERLPMR